MGGVKHEKVAEKAATEVDKEDLMEDDNGEDFQSHPNKRRRDEEDEDDDENDDDEVPLQAIPAPTPRPFHSPICNAYLCTLAWIIALPGWVWHDGGAPL